MSKIDNWFEEEAKRYKIIKEREMEARNLKITLDQAKKLAKESPEWKEIMISSGTFTENELRDIRLTYDEIKRNRKVWSIEIEHVVLQRYTLKIANLLKWMEIADEYNQGWVPNFDDNSEKWYAFKSCSEIMVATNNLSNNGAVFFRSKELAELAIKHNREIAEGLFHSLE
jgi:hypothetical protein